MAKFHWRKSLFLLMAIPMALFGQMIEDVVVDAQADQYASTGETVEVSISITHKSSSKVDASSFLTEEKPLSVEFVKEVKLSDRSDLIISIYSFTIPPKKEGLNFLPSISVTVGGEKYTSNQSTFTVHSSM